MIDLHIVRMYGPKCEFFWNRYTCYLILLSAGRFHCNDVFRSSPQSVWRDDHNEGGSRKRLIGCERYESEYYLTNFFLFRILIFKNFATWTQAIISSEI